MRKIQVEDVKGGLHEIDDGYIKATTIAKSGRRSTIMMK
jgi:hypothetical protein